MFPTSLVATSQEQNLHHNSFIQGDTAHNFDDTPSPLFPEIPVASAGIVMVSPPDSQDGAPYDVFHTPPEESSLPSSDDQQRATTVGVDRCAVNHAVDVDAGTEVFVDFYCYSDGTEFVDLGRDSELGFSEAQLSQKIDAAECSHGAPGDSLSEIPSSQFDELEVLERELSDLDESPVKKPKLPEHDLGFDSSGDCFEVQLQKLEDGTENCEGKAVSHAGKENCCGEISMDKDLGSRENVETQVDQLEMVTSDGDVNSCQSEKLACTIEGNKSSDEVIEDSPMRKKSDEEPGLRVLPASIRSRLENLASELECGKSPKKNECPVECGKSPKKNECPVFYVMKVLAENSPVVEDNVDDVNLFEAAKLCGVTFPRPRWWPDRDDFNKQQ